MKTKNRIKLKPTPKPSTDLIWVDIHDSGKLADGIHKPVAYGFMSPHLVKLLNRLLHGSRLGEVDDGQDGHTIEAIGNKTEWEVKGEVK